VLAAIDPDVIFLQELTDRNSASQLESFLDQRLPSEASNEWHVVFGAGGGNLRCAIASRLPLESAEPFELLPYPDWPQRSLRVAGAFVQFANKRLLCVSVHLRCCGGIGSQQDFIRILEVETIREELRKLAESGTIDGVIVAGDFNLVGSRRPLDLLTDQLHIDGLSLIAAQPYQLDGLSNATWSDRKQSFVPGRLDYLLFSSSTVALRSTFVLDARDLNPDALDRLGLRSDDTASASDHFPVVADVQWTVSEP
jgi:endonuclease/exonuclease/phosphatase family metal-dependent hydrolase